MARLLLEISSGPFSPSSKYAISPAAAAVCILLIMAFATVVTLLTSKRFRAAPGATDVDDAVTEASGSSGSLSVCESLPPTTISGADAGKLPQLARISVAAADSGAVQKKRGIAQLPKQPATAGKQVRRAKRLAFQEAMAQLAASERSMRIARSRAVSPDHSKPPLPAQPFAHIFQMKEQPSAGKTPTISVAQPV